MTPSESDDYGIMLKIKEIRTQEHHYMAKNISVIPRFSRRHFSADQERELETLSRMTNRPTVDDDFSSFSDFFFSIVKN